MRGKRPRSTARAPLRAALVLCAIAATTVPCTAQEGARVEVLNADTWAFDDRVAGAQRLRGNVRFRHAGALMACDSAWLHEDNRVIAFSRVRIDQGDSLRATGRRLEYDPRTRLALLEGDVVLRDGAMELLTPSLAYDLRGRSATYREGGRLTDREGAVLTSRAGTYLTDQRLMRFTGDVYYEHPERVIRSDTMHYATGSATASFHGPTTVLQTGDSTLLRTTSGTYDTRSGEARFTARSSVASGGRLLEGDTLHYDRATGTGRAWGRVQVTDSAEGTRALGRYGSHDERGGRTVITGRAELRLRMDPDTLYLHADTLFTVEATAGDSGRAGRIIARRNVRFFKRDMQGACDTLLYERADSLLRMYHRPVLWSGTDQITGRHIRLLLADGRPHRLFVDDSTFMLAQVDSARMDQVAGNRLTGFFQAGELRHLLVEGNARSVYHVREKKEDGDQDIGVNSAESGRIRVELDGGAVATVVFLDRPESVMHPPGEAASEAPLMEGALWRGDERPVDAEDIFRRPVQGSPKPVTSPGGG